MLLRSAASSGVDPSPLVRVFLTLWNSGLLLPVCRGVFPEFVVLVQVGMGECHWRDIAGWLRFPMSIYPTPVIRTHPR